MCNATDTGMCVLPCSYGGTTLAGAGHGSTVRSVTYVNMTADLGVS